MSYTFGPDCVTDFLQRHDLDLVCRAHQVRPVRGSALCCAGCGLHWQSRNASSSGACPLGSCSPPSSIADLCVPLVYLSLLLLPLLPLLPAQVVEEGYEFFAKRQLVTIFSAPNYCGEFENAGAMMSVDETLMCSFQVREGPEGLPSVPRCWTPCWQLHARPPTDTPLTHRPLTLPVPRPLPLRPACLHLPAHADPQASREEAESPVWRRLLKQLQQLGTACAAAAARSGRRWQRQRQAHVLSAACWAGRGGSLCVLRAPVRGSASACWQQQAVGGFCRAHCTLRRQCY